MFLFFTDLFEIALHTVSQNVYLLFRRLFNMNKLPFKFYLFSVAFPLLEPDSILLSQYFV